MHFSFQVYSGKKSQGGERNHNRVKYFSKSNFYRNSHHIDYSSGNKWASVVRDLIHDAEYPVGFGKVNNQNKLSV